MSRAWKAHLVPFAAGAVVFAAVQWWLLARSIGSGTSDPGWFLNGPDAGLAMLVSMAAGSALAAMSRRAHWLASAAAFTAGAVVAMIVVLFATGPGTIFPIVIVFGTAVLAVAALAGGGVGWLLRRLWTRRAV